MAANSGFQPWLRPLDDDDFFLQSWHQTSADQDYSRRSFMCPFPDDGNSSSESGSKLRHKLQQGLKSFTLLTDI